jgi:hypothetical protein
MIDKNLKVRYSRDKIGGLTLEIYRVKNHLCTIEVDALNRIAFMHWGEREASCSIRKECFTNLSKKMKPLEMEKEASQ